MFIKWLDVPHFTHVTNMCIRVMNWALNYGVGHKCTIHDDMLRKTAALRSLGVRSSSVNALIWIYIPSNYWNYTVIMYMYQTTILHAYMLPDTVLLHKCAISTSNELSIHINFPNWRVWAINCSDLIASLLSISTIYGRCRWLVVWIGHS